ncbi:MAG TPA: hypothetical protein VHE09_06855 [Rhizomicrobium sp.]|jgi:hypothetical protein|nr:hypothetical protein [Rhizomicrobium sp.]
MQYSTLALVATFALVSSAALADDPMANTYANTVTTKSQKTGQTGTLLFNADGSYSASTTGADGKPFAYQGKWVVKDGGATICLSPTLPNPPPTSCSPLHAHGVGDSWSVTNDQGETFDVSMTAGR